MFVESHKFANLQPLLQHLSACLCLGTSHSILMLMFLVIQVGAHLQDVAPAGLHSVFERFRAILHEGAIDKRCQYMIEGLFAVRKVSTLASHPGQTFAPWPGVCTLPWSGTALSSSKLCQHTVAQVLNNLHGLYNLRTKH